MPISPAYRSTPIRDTATKGVANLSIVLESSDGRWAKNVVCENEECLKLMEKVLELTLESAETVPAGTTEEAETSTPPKQVAQEILERMQGARQGDHLQLPAETIGDIPAEDEEE